MVAIDLDQRATQAGYGIGGYIGYSALRRLTLVIDARNGLIRVLPGKSASR